MIHDDCPYSDGEWDAIIATLPELLPRKRASRFAPLSEAESQELAVDNLMLNVMMAAQAYLSYRDLEFAKPPSDQTRKELKALTKALDGLGADACGYLDLGDPADREELSERAHLAVSHFDQKQDSGPREQDARDKFLQRLISLWEEYTGTLAGPVWEDKYYDATNPHHNEKWRGPIVKFAFAAAEPLAGEWGLGRALADCLKRKR